MIAQVLLVLATLAVARMVLKQGGGNRQLALRRLSGVALAAVGVVAVLVPGAVTWLARLVGIGRGTDLVLYAAVMFFLFTTASLYQRVAVLQNHVTTLVRELAVRHPDLPPSNRSMARVDD